MPSAGIDHALHQVGSLAAIDISAADRKSNSAARCVSRRSPAGYAVALEARYASRQQLDQLAMSGLAGGSTATRAGAGSVQHLQESHSRGGGIHRFRADPASEWAYAAKATPSVSVHAMSRPPRTISRASMGAPRPRDRSGGLRLRQRSPVAASSNGRMRSAQRSGTCRRRRSRCPRKLRPETPLHGLNEAAS